MGMSMRICVYMCTFTYGCVVSTCSQSCGHARLPELAQGDGPANANGIGHADRFPHGLLLVAPLEDVALELARRRNHQGHHRTKCDLRGVRVLRELASPLEDAHGRRRELRRLCLDIHRAVLECDHGALGYVDIHLDAVLDAVCPRLLQTGLQTSDQAVMHAVRCMTATITHYVRHRWAHARGSGARVN